MFRRSCSVPIVTVVRGVANYVNFSQAGSPRGACKACQVSSPKKNANLHTRIGALCVLGSLQTIPIPLVVSFEGTYRVLLLIAKGRMRFKGKVSLPPATLCRLAVVETNAISGYWR